MMLDRMEGNAELKSSVQLMLAARRLTHSVLLVGEEGLGAGFAARCIAADYLYPAGGAPAEALLRGECCRAVGKPGDRDSGHVETGIVREAISVAGMGAGGKYLVSQVKAMRSEIFNTSLSAEGRAVLLYHVEKMNEESANALLKVMEEPPEGVLFLLTADSLASVLPTIRSRCVSFAVAPVSPEQCARYCAAQGVDKKTAALYSELFDGHIGTVLAAAQDEARTAQVEKALQGGATFIQLREKNLDQDHFMEEALELKKLCAAYHVPFVINDNVEIAAKMDADGVHVGQSDMEAGDVRAKLGPDKIIGVSAQTVEQAILAEQRGADYLGVGAVFHTGSKADAEDVSHETLTAICNAVKIPVIAIGGITRDNVTELSGSGICGIAVISAIFAQKDIVSATKALKEQTLRMLENK